MGPWKKRPAATLAMRLAITIIDQRCHDARRSQNQPDLATYNSTAAIKDVFGRLIDEARNQGCPLLTTKEEHHSKKSLMNALNALISHDSLQPEYRADARQSGEVLRQCGSECLTAAAWDNLRSIGGVWMDDGQKEMALINHACAASSNPADILADSQKTQLSPARPLGRPRKAG